MPMLLLVEHAIWKFGLSVYFWTCISLILVNFQAFFTGPVQLLEQMSIFPFHANCLVCLLVSIIGGGWLIFSCMFSRYSPAWTLMDTLWLWTLAWKSWHLPQLMQCYQWNANQCCCGGADVNVPSGQQIIVLFMAFAICRSTSWKGYIPSEYSLVFFLLKIN